MPEVQQNNRHCVIDVQFDVGLIQNKLSNLKVGKVGGDDGLPSKFLKETSNTLAKPLYEIYKKSFLTGQIPENWREANVTPIFKSGDRTDPSNYRPVSLTCHCCKVFESILKDNLVEFLQSNSIINSNQHGFVKGKSWLTNLLSFLEDCSVSLDEGHPVDVLYLDFSKAFDSVPFKLLIHKLKMYMV